MSVPGVVGVWLVPVAAGAAEDPSLLALLGPGERAVIGSLGFAADRDRAVTARAVARRSLAEILGTTPAAVVADTRGSARVPEERTSVSWSHSGRWVALAIGSDRAVGIDVERVPARIPLEALARIGVRSLAEFVALEAASKATGCAFGGRWPPGIVSRRLAAPEGYLAAVAAPGDDWAAEVHFRAAAPSRSPAPSRLAAPGHPVFSFGTVEAD